MGMLDLLPCPFCGGKADPAGWWTATDGSSGPACEDCGAATEDAEAWNRRSDRAGLIAGLREAAEWHEAEAEKVQPSWPALASIEVPDAEALAIRRDISGHNRWSAMVFRARITALEEEGKK